MSRGHGIGAGRLPARESPATSGARPDATPARVPPGHDSAPAAAPAGVPPTDRKPARRADARPRHAPVPAFGAVASSRCLAPSTVPGARGRERWSVDLYASSSAPVLGDDGTLYVACGAGSSLTELMALRHGALQGPCLTGRFGPELFVGGGGDVLVRASTDAGGAIESFHPERGAGRVARSRGVWSLAADRSGRVYFLQVDRTLGAVDGSGALLWSLAGAGRRPWSGITAGEEGAFVTATDGLHAFVEGVERWHLGERAAPVPPVLGDDGLVYWVGWAEGRYEVLGVGARDGRAELRAPLSADAEPRDLTLGRQGEVYVRCADGRLRVHRQGGELRRTVDARAAGRAVTGQDGTVYVPGADGLVRALDREGEVRWSLQVSERAACTPPAIGGDGTVYVTSTDGRCVAIE